MPEFGRPPLLVDVKAPAKIKQPASGADAWKTKAVRVNCRKHFLILKNLPDFSRIFQIFQEYS